MLDERCRKHLLAVARDAIAWRLGLPSTPPPSLSDPSLQAAQPTFVTLTVAGTLRGCVGFTDHAGTLEATVASCAVAAATADPRFPPLTPEEFPRVGIEISLLSPPVPVAGPQDIAVGTHGIIVSQGGRRGLLLPQVAAEHGWAAEAFLAQAALKAGLRPEAWRAGARLEVFTAEAFSEG